MRFWLAFDEGENLDADEAVTRVQRRLGVRRVDLERALERVARGLESGTISVNSHSSVRYTTPFGGMKQSGLGRELGPDAALAFTETKNVFFSSAPPPVENASPPPPVE